MEKILDEIVRTSTRPLRYVVEDYGIVFEPGDRKLMVNPSTVPSATWVNTRKGPIARKLERDLDLRNRLQLTDARRSHR
jgi:hypothetical protein